MAEEFFSKAKGNVTRKIADLGKDIWSRDFDYEAIGNCFKQAEILKIELLSSAKCGNPFRIKLPDEIEDQQVRIDQHATGPILCDQPFKVFVQGVV